MNSTPTFYGYKENKQIAGKIYNFLDRRDWPYYAQATINLSDFGGPHSMLVIGGVRGSRGSLVRAFTVSLLFALMPSPHSTAEIHCIQITSTLDPSVHPDSYIPITWTHRRVKGLQLHLRRPYGFANPLSNKPRSWVRADSVKEIPSEILEQWRWENGNSVELQQKSLDSLQNHVRDREPRRVQKLRFANEGGVVPSDMLMDVAPYADHHTLHSME